MLGLTPTLKEFSESHQRFWEDQHLLLTQRMADVAVREAAFGAMRAEQVRGLPVYYQSSIYKALEDAERVRTRSLAEHSRKGGNAKKTDALQGLIESVAEKRPLITVKELERELRARQNIEIIEDIDDRVICFANGDKLKEAKLSGLKDRLSRAKKKLQSR
ncbi:MAG: hypothetical protein ABSA68_16125 [Xanthobacteraceae bacterium]|jgi:hypothetical protein